MEVMSVALSEAEAIQKIETLDISAPRKAWGTRMIQDVASNGVDRDLIVAYLEGLPIRDEAQEDIRANGAMIETSTGGTKKNPAVGVYNSEVNKLVKLSKVLGVMGVTPFEGA
jgi:P27 family predicted phage terminase small subunit